MGVRCGVFAVLGRSALVKPLDSSTVHQVNTVGVRAIEIIKAIHSSGGEFVHQRGSHQQWKIEADGKTFRTTVPMHSGDVPLGTAKQIEKSFEEVLGKGWLLK